MFNKTTSLQFSQFGTILNEDTFSKPEKFLKKSLRVTNKTIERFYHYASDVYIHVNKGLILLLVSTDETFQTVERFVIHRVTKIKKGVYFNFIALSSNGAVDIFYQGKNSKSVAHMKSSISYRRIMPSFHIKEIFAYYYQVRNLNYHFAGESHVYWELTYVDNGKLETTIDGEKFELNSFDCILYAPKQFHTQRTLSDKPCSYLTIMFDMDLKDYESIVSKVFHCKNDVFTSLSNFIKTSDAIDDMYSNDLLTCYMQELILKLLQYESFIKQSMPSVPIQQMFENEVLNQIVTYINENIDKALTIEDICFKFSISRSSLQTIFKDNLGVAPKHYINELKLAKSKLLIKEEKFTISEIALMLGFGSIHYFSRKFKQRYHISPSDYAKTIYN